MKTNKRKSSREEEGKDQFFFFVKFKQIAVNMILFSQRLQRISFGLMFTIIL